MVSSVRLRSEGLRFLRDRYQFLRAHVQADGDLDVGGDVVVKGDAIIENIAVTGTTRIIEYSSDQNFVQTVRIEDWSTQQEIPFLCAANGFIRRISHVWMADPGLAKGGQVTLGDGGGLRDEDNEFTVTSDADPVGDVTEADWTIEGNAVAEVLAICTRGALRYISVDRIVSGTGAVAGVFLIEITPTVETF